MHQVDLLRLRTMLIRVLSLVIIIGFFALSGCISSQNSNKISHEARAEADKMAAIQGFDKVLLKTNPFLLTSYQKFSPNSQSPFLTVYIEGDGRTWITRSKLSTDPTPRNPLALKLAFLDPSPNVAYLARPCQFTPQHLETECQSVIWSDQRFSEKVIAAMNQAVDQLKANAKAKQIQLVGFSGGAAIAVLIAARRHDVATLTTVAGDLDHQALSEYHHTTPLTNSLNPRSVLSKLVQLPQHHFSGEKDLVVPGFIAANFVADLKKFGAHCATNITIQGTTHHEGWEKGWPQLLSLPFK